jgi:glutaredoxin
MKKVLIVAFAIFAFLMVDTVKAKEVPVYMLTKEGCPACESALEFFANLDKEHPNTFKLYTIEVFDSEWGVRSQVLEELLTSVYKYFGDDEGQVATPTIVIGEYHTIGLPKDTSVIYKKIVETKEKKKKDVLKELAQKLDIDVDNLPKPEDTNTTTTGEKTETTSSKSDVLMIVLAAIVLVGGFTGLAVSSSKK